MAHDSAEPRPDLEKTTPHNKLDRHRAKLATPRGPQGYGDDARVANCTRGARAVANFCERVELGNGGGGTVDRHGRVQRLL